MKKINLLLVLVAMLALVGYKKIDFVPKEDITKAEKEIKALISKMSLEEKIGQMSQLNIPHNATAVPEYIKDAISMHSLGFNVSRTYMFFLSTICCWCLDIF